MGAIPASSLPGRSRGPSAQRWFQQAEVRWALLGTAIFAFAAFTEVTNGGITNDEAWFLQVARRMVSGEVLYRDIFFGVTPLSAYLTAGFVRLMGVEILVIRGMMAACLVAACLLSLRITRQLGLSQTAKALVLLGILAFVPAWLPGAGSPYAPLAYVFLLACLSATLTWLEGTRSKSSRPGAGFPSLLVAGGFAGLAFASKQNIGGFAIAALWAVALTTSPSASPDLRGKLRSLLGASLAFGVVIILILIPVWFTGGFSKFLEYGFLNRSRYAAAAAISYWPQLRQGVTLLLQPKLLRDVLYGYWSFQFLLPMAAFPALGWAWYRSGSGRRSLALTLFAFSAAAFAGAFPRVDLAHVAPIVAPLAIALAWSLEQIMPTRSPAVARAGRALMALGLAVGIAAQVARPWRWLALGTHALSPLPHFHGVILARDWTKAILLQSQEIRAEAPPSEPLFLLSPSAGLLYLLTDRPNPTPFDYPLVTAFGRDGEESVIREITRGRIQWVCLTPLGTNPLSPSRLEAFVQERMLLTHDAGICQLYRRIP